MEIVIGLIMFFVVIPFFINMFEKCRLCNNRGNLKDYMVEGENHEGKYITYWKLCSDCIKELNDKKEARKYNNNRQDPSDEFDKDDFAYDVPYFDNAIYYEDAIEDKDDFFE